MMIARTWFIPSFYGDIRLEAQDKHTTILIAEALTPAEADMLRKLRDSRCESGILDGAWAERAAFNEAGIEGEVGSPYRHSGTARITLHAPLLRVERALTKLTKPGRTIARAVVFRANEDEPKIVPVVEDKLAEAPKEEPAAGASVATPVRGCPFPTFEQVQVRATRVLKHFLSRTQLRDFERTQQFLVEGADTGTRYLLTSRNAGAPFERAGRRSVYDLDRCYPVCVHDWAVPAAEELLGLLIHFSIRGGERHMLQMPEGEHA